MTSPGLPSLDRYSVTDRGVYLPYVAAGWASVMVLGLTLLVHELGPTPASPQASQWFRLGGGWIALLVGALAWVVVSEPLRLRDEVVEASRRLEQSERRFRKLCQEAPLAYVTFDEDGIVRQVNRWFEEMLGYDAADVRGRPIREVFVLGSGTGDRVDEVLGPDAWKRPLDRREVRAETRDGEERWVALSVRRVPSVGGEAPLGLAMLVDVTERKRTEHPNACSRCSSEARRRGTTGRARAWGWPSAGGSWNATAAGSR